MLAWEQLTSRILPRSHFLRRLGVQSTISWKRVRFLVADVPFDGRLQGTFLD